MKQYLQYGTIALPLAFAGIPLYLYAPDYYTRDLGLSVGLLGALLLVLRLFDAVQDPIIGHYSDKYSSKRRSIFILGIALLIAGLGIVLNGAFAFLPVSIWFTLGMFFAVTGFSIVSINLNMIGGFITDDAQKRTRYSAWREGFMLAGLLLAVMLPTVLQRLDVDNDLSFQITFMVFLGIVGVTAFGFFKFLSVKDSITQSSDYKFSFKKLFVNSQSKFFVICGLSQLSSAFPAVLVLFFIKDYLQAEAYVGAFLFAYFAAGAALMPIWVKLSHKIGKPQAWLASMILASVTFIWAFTLVEGDVIAFGLICVLSGLALGADLALPPAILADRISADASRKDTALTSYYATLSFIGKAVLGIAGGIAFLILDMVGFEAGSPDNSTLALNAVIAMYALVPCLIKLVAVVLLYRLNNHRV